MGKEPNTAAGIPQGCESCDKLRQFGGSWELNPCDYCGITGKAIIRTDKVAEWCPKLPETVRVKEISRKLTEDDLEEIRKFEAALDEKQKRIENMEKIIEDQQERIDIMPEGGWISVKDRLPEQRIGVLVYCPEYNNVFAGELNDYLKKGQWYFFDDEIKHPIKEEVTHWMPMPKPPEVGEDE